MKNLLLIFCTLFFLINCQNDREMEEANSSQFGFTIDRDENFIEKSVGEVNQLKFNINPKYDFNALETSFKFTTNLDGILKLNGETLTANKKYTFSSKDNIFEYVGNVSGNHQLKFTIENSKGYTQEESFELKYSISEFALSYTGGTANIYQGDETVYTHKIVPTNGSSSGYQVRFDSYDGDILYNGVAAQLDQFYPINNINNFSIALKTSTPGQGKLSYTIKNATVSKPYEIQQTVTAREIVIESMNINATSVLQNANLNLIGVIKKTPVTNNTTVKYKTWVSSSSNNNSSGLQNTQNAYIPYSLGANGLFNYDFNALEEGSYTYNIQAQDEYGNESAVKSFNITVAPNIKFIGAVNMVLDARYKIQFLNDVKTYIKDFKRSFHVQTGGNLTVTKVEYALSFTHIGQNFYYNFSENVTNGTNSYEVTDENFGISLINMGFYNGSMVTNPFLTNVNCTIKATASDGSTVEKTISPTFTVAIGLT